MSRLLAILAMSLWACSAGEAQSTKDEVHFRATVQDVGLLSHFSGKAIMIGFDPRFALTVRIESAAPAVPGFTPGDVVTFAIHSPAMLFAEGEATKGKSYDFSVVRTSKKGKIRFSSLQVLDVPADKSAPANPRHTASPRVTSLPRASAKGHDSRIVLAFCVPRVSSLIAATLRPTD